MEYLLGEIAVDGPDHRAEAVKVNKQAGHKLAWPEGWWAVSDDQFAYLAFFQFESDAWAYRLNLINLRMNAKDGHNRYIKSDSEIEDREEKEAEREEKELQALRGEFPNADQCKKIEKVIDDGKSRNAGEIYQVAAKICQNISRQYIFNLLKKGGYNRSGTGEHAVFRKSMKFGL